MRRPELRRLGDQRRLDYRRSSARSLRLHPARSVHRPGGLLHSFGLFQDTPACDGAFGLTDSLDGNTCTPTTTADDVPFGPSVSFYCESATSLKGLYIDAVEDTTSPLYAKSVFNPAYQIYTYYSEWSAVSQQGNANATGCSTAQTWYLTMAIWNTGVASDTCALSGNGASYVQNVIQGYQGLYNVMWPYPFP